MKGVKDAFFSFSPICYNNTLKYKYIRSSR